MKLTKILLLLLIISNFSFSQKYEHNINSEENYKNGRRNCVQVIDSIKYDLSSQEKDGFIYMRLEEKLAHAVYLTLGMIYTQKFF